MILLISALLLGAGDAQTPVGSGPMPSLTPISWEFDFRYQPPQRIEMQLPGHDSPDVYWYMVYTVTNTSGTTQRFMPTFQLVTEELRVIDTDSGINPVVFEAIRDRHSTTHKYLVHPTQAIGDLAVGDDNARESVAIWRATDVNVNNFSIYAAGLCGEAQLLRNPAYDAKQPETRRIAGSDGVERDVVVNPKHFVIRKTLELRYEWPGSEAARETSRPRLASAKWIMR